MHRLVHTLVGIVLWVGVATGASGPVAGQSAPGGQAPAADAADAVARADAAMKALQGALLSRLREEMARGGPPAAIAVCRDEAQAITARIA